MTSRGAEYNDRYEAGDSNLEYSLGLSYIWRRSTQDVAPVAREKQHRFPSTARFIALSGRPRAPGTRGRKHGEPRRISILGAA